MVIPTLWLCLAAWPALVPHEGTGGRLGQVARTVTVSGARTTRLPFDAIRAHSRSLDTLRKERRRVGGSSRRRSPRGLVPTNYRQARSIVAFGGRRIVTRGDGASAGYKLTPKSYPTRAGRLKAATSRAMPGQTSSKALVRHEADPREALAGVLGTAAEAEDMS